MEGRPRSDSLFCTATVHRSYRLTSSFFVLGDCTIEYLPDQHGSRWIKINRGTRQGDSGHRQHTLSPTRPPSYRESRQRIPSDVTENMERRICRRL